MRPVRSLIPLVLATACSSATLPDSEGPGPGPGPGGSDAAVLPPTIDAGPNPAPDSGPGPQLDAGPTSTTATIRVHYPAGSHRLALRGGSVPLSWAQGASMNGTSDTFVYTLTGLTTTIEWKPLLDDTTWALGPNYHIGPGQTIDVYPRFTGAKGQVVTLIAAFHSTILGNNRPVYAYLPASYAENTSARYPVVYMHDGQNLWAALPQLAFSDTWNVDTAFDDAARLGACSAGGTTGWGAQPLGGAAKTCNGDGDCTSGECRTFPEAIVIGVGNTSGRMFEYTPTTDPGYSGGGGGDKYLAMLVTELKPQIDSMLRTRTDKASTALVGSSLGGLISAYGGVQRPDVFGLIGAISPSTWWNSDVIVTDVAGTRPAPNRPLRVYVDSGGSADDQSDTDLLAAAYLRLGYRDGVDFRHVVQPNAQHAELYWAQRLPGALQQLLGAR